LNAFVRPYVVYILPLRFIMKTFEVPVFYRSTILSTLKEKRKQDDKMKKDFTPSCLDYGKVTFYLARHFGFCYGVENAIEIAFKTVAENEGKRIYLLSEMIHNPQVNKDLMDSGVQFILNTNGETIIPWNEITNNDIVIIPAFGTTLEVEALLKQKGIDPLQYNTTCPFVERVWKKSNQIAEKQYSIIIHGKPSHEETKATFSHSAKVAPSLVIKDMEEAILLAKYIKNELPEAQFYKDFEGRYSSNFDVKKDLLKMGVVNQTTMLAEDTQAIVEYIKNTFKTKFELNEETILDYFADTRDTLCYATNDNQMAVKGMLLQDADMAIVVGGYNSSNTSHLVELCEEKLTTYFVKDANNFVDANSIIHHHFRNHTETITHNYLPQKENIKILVTGGASCPDAVVEQVLSKILSFYNLQLENNI
jgi:4-hydroxy-3-methylbut-2-en-1-yl diphosphate reductase